jgi:SAM-dependent methyltransferase
MKAAEPAGPVAGAPLDDWVVAILADPVTKQRAAPSDFGGAAGVVDARIYLRNTLGFADWESGQVAYERWEVSGAGYQNEVARYRAEIERDRPTYERFKLTGTILDVGGGAGTVREFLAADARFVAIDPFIDVIGRVPPAKREAYACLARPLNFVAAMAEFLPFQAESFDWVHMRSMLDHVQVPDLALLEACRVLKPGGQLLVGMYVEGGKSGRKTLDRQAKDIVKESLARVGIDRWKDHHTWHPTYVNLCKLISENGYVITDTYWQPDWNDTVCYVAARKA